MRRLVLLAGIWMGGLVLPVHAQQQPELPLLMEELLEQAAADEAAYDWEEELETLDELLCHPLDLNHATRAQLEQLPFLNDLQVEQLLDYVRQHGGLASLYELQALTALDKETIDRLKPFVSLTPRPATTSHFPTWKELAARGRHELLTRMNIPLYTRDGYRNRYLGPSLYHNLRYNFRCGDFLTVGLTAEKDAGEPLFALHNGKGYDAYHPYLLLHDLGPLKTLAVGCYRLHFGLGLTVGSGFPGGKSYSIAAATFRSSSVRAHTSTDEYNYFQGIALTLTPLRRTELTAFYSRRHMDGTVRADTLTAIDKSGLHRSQSEADKRGAFLLQTAGGHLHYRHRLFQAGLTGLHYRFSLPYYPSLSSKYARYNLRGRQFYNLSADYQLRLGRFFLQGESATGSRGYALLHQLHVRLCDDLRLLLTHRCYSHDYWALFARSFGESSTTQNENGWYLAAEGSPLAHCTLFAAIDLYSHPWWKYRISKPSQGQDYLTQAVWTPRAPLRFMLNYRYRHKERDVTGSGGRDTRPTHHHRTRFRFSYEGTVWKTRTTLDYNHFHLQGTAPSQGWQVAQAVSLTPRKGTLRTTLQAAYFHTDDYDSRNYLSEKNLLHTFYTPSFYGEGVRCMWHVRCDLLLRFTLLLKWGYTHYFDRHEIGSGPDLIRSNHKSDVQLQFRARF